MTASLRLVLALLILVTLTSPAAAGPRRDGWERTLQRVADAVLVLEVSATRPLDTEGATSMVGTGFVVDRDLGLVLTNRHLVQVGPVRARAVTRNNEEVELVAVYRDPIHDFGFYRFDPAQVRFMELAELELAPERARVGAEIRVVGNDAGEKLSILDGTLARLDRPAPDYGRGSYNDFNTFYYQAATSTSGGSSGSPVVDRSGRVVALNAGGSRSAASSFYLPVDRARRVLEHLRRGEPVPRGTLQVVFQHEPFEQLRRLGLDPATEARIRAATPDGTGLLVVREVVPGGPGDGQLQPGDILVRVGDTEAPGFDDLEQRLDAAVGRAVRLGVERGGRALALDLGVDDLHTLSPARYVEFSQAVLQETSLQVARNRNVAAEGVLLVEPGYAFRRARIPAESVLLEVDDRPVPDLDALVAILATLRDGQDVRVRYRHLAQPRQDRVDVFTADRRWAPARDCQRDDVAGIWTCADLPAPEEAGPATAPRGSSATFEQVRDPVAAALAPSLCHVRFTIPYRTEGVEGWTYVGAGLVVDEGRGLVVTDRGTVPIALGDVELTFAGAVRVPARVIFLHPLHNVALLQYDPARLGDMPVKPARLVPGPDLDAGDTVHQVGLTSAMRVVSQATTISRVDMAGSTVTSPPTFREANAELYRLAESASSIGGVLADPTGGVLALWAFNLEESSGHFTGLPVDLVRDAVAPFLDGSTPVIRDLGVEVSAVSLAEARDRGVPDPWLSRLAAADPERRQVLSVVRVHPEVPAREALQGGDLLLAVDDVPLTRPRSLEVGVRGQDRVRVHRVRSGVLEEVEIAPVVLDGDGVDRVVSFAGALFHEPHWPMGMQHGVDAEGLYLSWYWYGGPAARYGLRASTVVRAVNDVPVEGLDRFLEVVGALPDRAPVRLTVESLNGVEEVATLLTDLVYWPTAEITRGTDGAWSYRELPR